MITLGRTWRGLWTLAGILLLMAGLISGCSEESNEAAMGSSREGGAGSGNEPFPMKLMIPGLNAENPGKDNAFHQAIEQYTNSSLDITWVPQDTYDEKSNLLMVSGELPDLMYVKSMKSSSFLNAIKAGAFWEIGPELKNYPNLSQANEEILDNLAIDGKVYAVYRHSAPAQVGVTYRKDWLERLGLSEPRTPEELYKLLKAFKENDPDQNGKDDTYGFIYWKEDFLSMFRILANWYGSPNIWGVDENGELIPDFVTKEYMDALNFMKRLYDEELMNANFAVLAGAKANDMFLAGEGGAMFSSLNNPAAWSLAGKTEPGAELGVFSTLEAGYGKRARAGSGYLGVYMIPKRSVQTEEQFHRILQFLDQMNDAPMQNLLEYGIEGRHYKVEDGKAVMLDTELMQSEIMDYKHLQLKVAMNLLPAGGLHPVQEKVEELKAANEEYAVYNPAQPFDSNTYTKQGQQLDDMRYDMMAKYVMGDLDAEGYQKAVQKWMDAGGSKVIEELNQQYRRSKK
ncbi:extracellular solute-binding protein [Paenibacillus sp. F411]|uniref:extracellular solute-binding protein n=1 Tax=Paenibacillus sp. F411 TaxID=2820239 RepID=UPI001AAEAC52|nr:extracellular solute-binding protein [Paenibacillus sp. F411]MBO2945602.1 extracellular solute-binding protein [Paenibacillus sp. F411]